MMMINSNRHKTLFQSCLTTDIGRIMRKPSEIENEVVFSALRTVDVSKIGFAEHRHNKGQLRSLYLLLKKRCYRRWHTPVNDRPALRSLGNIALSDGLRP